MADEVQAKIAAVWNSMDASWESYGKILEDKARANTSKVAVRTDHEQITYAQLEARVNRVGNALAALGVAKGDKVCVMLPNIPEFLYVWWGNAKLGGVTVPLNTALKGEGLAYVINHSDAETLVLSQRWRRSALPWTISSALLSWVLRATVPPTSPKVLSTSGSS